MTQVQRNAIASPATGLLIFQTNNTPGFYYYNGTAWKAITQKSSGWSLTGNSGADPSTNFLGTTDAQPLVFRVNNFKSGIIDYSTLSANTGFGYQTLNSNTANYNSAFGYQALMNNNSGYSNTATGYQSLLSNTIGYSNIANGAYSLYSNTYGNSNVASGYAALYHNISGSGNIASGYGALYNNTGGFSNIALGTRALFYSTSPHNQVAIGDSALHNFSGSQVWYSGNVAIGSKAMYSTSTGDLNVAVGWSSLYYNLNGNDNVAVGYQSLYNNNGYSNSANGMMSLYSNTDVSDNTASGFDALYYNTVGIGNTAVGYQALMTVSSGSHNTAIGYNADVTGDNYSNTTTIGYNAVGTTSNQVRIGNSAVTSIGGFANWTNISDGRYKKNIKENVPGLSFIKKLRPVSYTLDIHGIENFLKPAGKHYDKSQPGSASQMKEQDEKNMAEKEKVVYTGFVAQEVEKSAKELGYDFSRVDIPKDNNSLYGLRYSDFVVPLVKAVQDLSKMNDDKDAKINDLQKQIDELKAIVLSGTKINSVQNSNLQQQKISLTDASLDQNTPNPFNSTTAIHYTLPQKYLSAQIIITDQNGKALKQLNISGAGKGSLNIDAATLSAGAYNYSMYVDGKLIGSKQMVHIK